MKTKVKLSLIALLVLTLSVGLSIPSISIGAPEDTKVITLGAAVSLTGRLATLGGYTKDGYDFVVQKVNERGGFVRDGTRYKLRIKYYDDESKPAKAKSLAQKLITQDKIKYIIGPYSSGITLAALPVTERNHVPMVEGQGASMDIFNKGYEYVFAVLNTTSYYIKSAIELAATFTDPPVETAVIGVVNDHFSINVGDGAAKYLKENGIEVLAYEKFPLEARDISSFLTKVENLQPDMLIESGHTEGAALLAKQMKEMKVNVPFVVATHADAAKIDEILGEDVNGFATPSQWSPNLGWEGFFFGSPQDFALLFEEEYGYKPPYQVAEAAACVLTYIDAFKRSEKLTSEAVRDALAKTDIETFYGPINFNEKGINIAKPMVLEQWQKGERKIIAPPEFAEVEPLYPKPKFK